MIRLALALAVGLILSAVAVASDAASAWRAAVAVGARPAPVAPPKPKVVVPDPPPIPPAPKPAPKAVVVVPPPAPVAKQTVVTTTRSDLHGHYCPYCKKVTITHGPESHGNVAAHTCPECGRVLPRPWLQTTPATRVVARPAAVYSQRRVPPVVNQTYESIPGIGCPNGRCPNQR